MSFLRGTAQRTVVPPVLRPLRDIGILLAALAVGTGPIAAAEVGFTRVNLDTSFTDPTDVFAADIDGDGHLDVLGTARVRREVAWWANPGNATIVNPAAWTKTVLPTTFQGPNAVTTGDLDGDGDPDVVATAGLDGLAFWRNPGGAAARVAAQWQRVTVDGSLTGASDVVVADVNDDGLPDLVVCEGVTGRISWYRNPGGATIVNGAAWTATVIGTGLTSVNGAAGVRAHDFDGDGDPDIVAVGINAARMFRNPGGTRTTNPAQWLVTSFTGSFTGSSSLKLADVNVDGNMDLLVALGGQNYVLWLENPDGPDDARGSAATQWSRRQLDALSVAFAGGVNDVAPGDFDADGDVDIAVAPSALNQLAWLDGPTGATIVNPLAWTRRTIDPSLNSPAAVHVADLDGNGTRDVVGAGGGNNVVTIHLNQSPAIAFRITDVQITAEDDETITYQLTWSSIGGVVYAVESTDDLIDWSPAAVVPSQGTTTTAEITVSKEASRAYWRAVADGGAGS